VVFPEKENEYAIAPSLQEGIIWQVHDLLTHAPPGEAFDIVFMRNNLLTYFQEEMIQKPLERIAGALVPDGFLIIGTKETMPKAGEAFFRPWTGVFTGKRVVKACCSRYLLGVDAL
jgi:chemotaxis methyl-accepting protein methylase